MQNNLIFRLLCRLCSFLSTSYQLPFINCCYLWPSVVYKAISASTGAALYLSCSLVWKTGLSRPCLAPGPDVNRVPSDSAARRSASRSTTSCAP